MGNSTASGHDHIDTMAIKAAADILAKPICHIANLSIRNSEYIDDWKKAKLIPIFKGKGISRMSPGSYRPVAMLPSLSKIVEKVVQTQIISFMNKSGQFNDNLHAYREQYSTTSTLLQLSDSILEATDSNLISTLVTIDESSAFDCVSAKILEDKLRIYNFDNKSRKWIQDYMTNRQLYVEIGTKKSDTCIVNRGVPQGSILGPLLFSIFTNELPETAVEKNCQNPAHGKREKLFSYNCKHCGTLPCYADDATLHITTKNREISQKIIPEKIEIIKNFLNSQELAVNVGKTNLLESMVRQKRQKLRGFQPTLETINELGEVENIKPKKQIRLLGITLEQNLSWKQHLITGDKAVLPTARKQLGSLKRISKQIPRKSRLQLANGLILSRISYGMAVWGGTYNSNISKVQVFMNKMARWILNSGRKVKQLELMKQCNWLTAKEMIEMYTLTNLWKVIWKEIPKQLSEKLEIDDQML